MKGSIVYKGERIARNSEAYALWEAKNFQALDKHMSKVHREAVDRGEIRQQAAPAGDCPLCEAGVPTASSFYDQLKGAVESFRKGEVAIIMGGRRNGKSMLAQQTAELIIQAEMETQQRRSAQLRFEMVKARALPGDSGLTLGDIHAAPITMPDDPTS